MKKLTRRQQQFLGKVLDLYTQEQQPLHYAALAEYIGVSKVSAYEMLRLLEEHGLIEAEYQLPENLRGPGRASVVFRPTLLASQELARLAGGDVNQQEWAAIKAHILKELEAGRVKDYDALLEELLARIPEQHSSVIDLRDLQRVRQAGDIMVARRRDEYLRFVFQAPEGVGVQYAVAVALENRAYRAGLLRMLTSARKSALHCKRRETFL